MEVTSDNIVPIDFSRLEIYEIGALIVTVLTHSAPGDTDEVRGDVHAYLCKWALGARAAQGGQWILTPRPIKPLYAAFPDDAGPKISRKLNQRFSQRMLAAQMVIPFLRQAVEGRVPKMDPQPARLSINAMAERVLPASNESDPGNVETRIWRPSRSVIHLAAAVAVAQNDHTGTSDTPLSYDQLLWDEKLLQSILEQAELYESILAQCVAKEQLSLELAQLIRLRPAGRSVGSEKS